MTGDRAATFLAAALVGYAVAAGLVSLRLRAVPARLVRTNVDGRPVPAVLGGPLVLGALVALAGAIAAAALGWEPAAVGSAGAATALVLVATFAAGLLDDLRGDEADRGMAGHARALRGGRLTGGIVKAVAGVGAGLLAGALVATGATVVVVALLVAASANLVNLFDRAPGRAAKVALAAVVVLVAAGSGQWGVAAAGLAGALLACLPHDLGARAMLGDAGANPLGGVIGLGLAVSLGPLGRAVALAFVIALNLASERWSFSTAIERTPLLRALDHWGRK